MEHNGPTLARGVGEGQARQRQGAGNVRDHNAFTRRLRRESTPAERRLWEQLRDRRIGLRFRRQHPVGRYVADFACIEARLLIEVDGGVHDVFPGDQLRTEALEAMGWRVLRVLNEAVFYDLPGVLETIRAALKRG